MSHISLLRRQTEATPISLLLLRTYSSLSNLPQTRSRGPKGMGILAPKPGVKRQMIDYPLNFAREARTPPPPPSPPPSINT